MKNSRLVFVALLAVLAASCSRGARVSGVLKDAPEAEVEVRLLDINRYRTLDTLKTDARGAFSYVAEVEKGQPDFRPETGLRSFPTPSATTVSPVLRRRPNSLK